VAYSQQLATEIAFLVRKILQARWFTRYFPTRLDRTRVGDLATTAGGRLYADSVEGSITGRAASIIIFDDPLKISDAGNLKQIEKVNRLFDTEVMSRFDVPKTGRVVINAHRVHSEDLSGHVLQSGDWTHIALPLIAPSDQDYDLGDGKVWHRMTGELLRPAAFTEADVNRLKNSIVNPDFDVLYQQCRELDAIRIGANAFGSFIVSPSDAPALICVDPGHRPGPGHSFTVMQAWSWTGNEIFWLDQWRRQADVDTVTRALIGGTLNCQPAVVLIEDSGYGQTLFRVLRKRFSSLDIRLILPEQRSKSARLLRHLDLIQSGRIKLPQDAHWRGVWEPEIDSFPHGPFDDQVDTMMLGLDFIVQDPELRKIRQRRCLGVMVNNMGIPTFADQQSSLSFRSPYASLSRRQRMNRIFPPDDTC
jgi:phage terminase large subunit-like protein